MTNPFQEIADAFKAETGCEMNVTFANAAQIQTQIQTTETGDFFIAGSADELKPVESYVDRSEDLVKHIPVIAVPSANPKGIASLADLANCDTLLIGDPESTPIGKIAQKALTDAGVWEGLQGKGAITTTTTAPQIATALANGEGVKFGEYFAVRMYLGGRLETPDAPLTEENPVHARIITGRKLKIDRTQYTFRNVEADGDEQPSTDDAAQPADGE